MSGVTCAQTHFARNLNSCFIIHSKNTCLKNFRVLNGEGAGILGMYSKNIILDCLKYYCNERSHGIATNAADTVHLISCMGNIEIVNSIFESMKNNARNIHGNYYTVQSSSDGIIHAKLNTDTQANPAVNAYYKMFGEGDTVAVYRGNTTLMKNTLLVERVDITRDYTTYLYVNGDTSLLCTGGQHRKSHCSGRCLYKKLPLWKGKDTPASPGRRGNTPDR